MNGQPLKCMPRLANAGLPSTSRGAGTNADFPSAWIVFINAARAAFVPRGVVPAAMTYSTPSLDTERSRYPSRRAFRSGVLEGRRVGPSFVPTTICTPLPPSGEAVTGTSFPVNSFEIPGQILHAILHERRLVGIGHNRGVVEYHPFGSRAVQCRRYRKDEGNRQGRAETCVSESWCRSLVIAGGPNVLDLFQRPSLGFWNPEQHVEQVDQGGAAETPKRAAVAQVLLHEREDQVADVGEEP